MDGFLLCSLMECKNGVEKHEEVDGGDNKKPGKQELESGDESDDESDDDLDGEEGQLTPSDHFEEALSPLRVEERYDNHPFCRDRLQNCAVTCCVL